jgi:hypothetical protein
MQDHKTLHRRQFGGLMLVAAVAAVALQPTTASAHHSFGKFDMMKLTTLNGTVRDWKWANPHSWLTLTVVKADGSSEEWALVGSSPNMMARWGWNASDIRVGDKLTVDVHAGRDGERIGAIKNVFLPNGKVLTDPAGSNGQELSSAGPAAPPSKPEGELYK